MGFSPMTDQDGPAARPVLLLRQVMRVREKGGVCFELKVPFLSVEAGQFVALVGSNGCGKSTMLDLLGLVLRPHQAGEFSIGLNTAGLRDVSRINERALAEIRREHIGYVLQSGGLLPFLTVRENILLPRWINGLSGQEKALTPLAERLGILDQLNKKPQHLSGGQRQRAAIARALIHRPRIVLADEPTAAVDKHSAVEIRNEFRALTRQMGVTLVMATHDYGLVREVVDRTFGFEVKQEAPGRTTSRLFELEETRHG